MKYHALFLTIVSVAAQQPRQSQTNVYTYDANGSRVLAGQQVTGGGRSEQRVQNLNGRSSALEQVEEKVLREDSTGRVVEKIVRPFDANGVPQPPQKIRITETNQGAGVKSIETQVFHGNINGGYALSERRQALERTSDGRVTVETQVARPTLNGGLDTVEKLSKTIITAGDKTNEDTLTYRRDSNGSFYTAAREVKESDKKDGRTVESTATYISGERRQLELAGQTVAETVKRPDGSETTQVNVFGTAAPGRPASGQAVLREQQIIEKNKTAGGVVETFSVRRPAVDNPNALGPAQKVSEKVCSGPCQ
ncbi:MAG: hypothetical protein JNM66_22365 [Bryobacterales bacterium]|nr:hypothetical protein [Bryobacterales bacterium]